MEKRVEVKVQEDDLRIVLIIENEIRDIALEIWDIWEHILGTSPYSIMLAEKRFTPTLNDN